MGSEEVLCDRIEQMQNILKERERDTYRFDRRQGLPASALILQHDLVECNGSRGLLGGVVEFLLSHNPFLKSLFEFFLGLCNTVVVGMRLFGLGITFVVLDGSANVKYKVVGESR